MHLIFSNCRSKLPKVSWLCLDPTLIRCAPTWDLIRLLMCNPTMTRFVVNIVFGLVGLYLLFCGQNKLAFMWCNYQTECLFFSMFICVGYELTNFFFCIAQVSLLLRESFIGSFSACERPFMKVPFLFVIDGISYFGCTAYACTDSLVMYGVYNIMSTNKHFRINQSPLCYFDQWHLWG